MKPWMLDLVRVGLHGFALAMAFFGYNLLKKITNKDLPPDNPAALEQFKISVRSVRFFLVISLIFFFGGAILHITDKYFDIEKEYSIQLSLVPEEISEDLIPSIRNRDRKIKLLNGTGELKINGKSFLLINAEKLVAKLNEIKANLNETLTTSPTSDPADVTSNEGGL